MIIVMMMIATMATMALAADTKEGYLDGGMGANATRVNGNPESVTATGGNITQTNFTIEQQTSYWAGFYGNVSQFPVLEGNTNNFFTWTGGISFTGGYVMFVNESTVDWNNIVVANQVQRQAEDTALGLTGEPDSVDNTFTLTNNAQLNVSGNVFAPGATVSVNTSSTGGNPDWETVMLRDTTNSLILYGAVINPGNPNYAGQASDYQAMVPTDGTQRTYYVYIGLE